jgi:hypothetical protein
MEDEITWEHEEDLRADYPELFLSASESRGWVIIPKMKLPGSMKKPGQFGCSGWNKGRISFWILNWILEFGKPLKFCTRRFRRNLDRVFFLKSSRLSRDFRKMKYVMPWYAT